MRLPVSLHVVAGFLLVVALVLAETQGKKVEKKDELKKPETNAITEKPTLFGFIRRLLPENTLEKLREAVTAKPKPKSSKTSKPKSKNSVTAAPTSPTKVKDGRSLKSTKKSKSTKPTPTVAAPAKKTKVTGAIKVHTSLKTIPTTAAAKTKSKQKSTKKSTTGKTTLKPKTPRYLSSSSNRQNDRLSGFTAVSSSASPTPAEMEILTYEQKSSRLRQELIRETEDNCLAKILCGAPGTKPKPKEKNTFVSDTAYLIKEFFNIFDFTIDEAAEKNTKAVAGESPSNDDDESQEDDEGTDDDEEDDIYRTSPVVIEEKPKKTKYTTNKNKKNQPELLKTSRPVMSSSYAVETDPTTTTTTTTSTLPTTTTRRPKPVSVAPHEDEETTTTMGDLVPIIPSTSKYVTEDRLGEFSTQVPGLMTSTIISTSMTGSAAVKPMGLAFAIPIKTAKDDVDDDDDEEDDNPKYSDDRFEEDEDDSTYHRVTLEELVGDIKLNPSDFTMLRRGRSMKIPLTNVTSDKYIQSKLKQMHQVKNEVKKLRIAQKVARSMREPRQCRQFNQVAEEVLQTCPLTREVIRFFNTNLRNGTTIEVKKTPPVRNSTLGAGLVLLNTEVDGTQQAFFVDSNKNNVNTKVTTDLKNPSIPSSYTQDELEYPIYEKRPNPNPQNANLNQHGKDITRKPAPQRQKQKDPENSKEDSEETNDDEDSDEDRDDEEENDFTGRREQRDEEEYDDEEQDDEPEGEEEDDGDEEDEEDYDNSTDDASRDREHNLKKVQKPQIPPIPVQQNYEKIQGSDTNQPNIKIAFRPKPVKRPVPPPPTLPPGIIRVYGVPTNSFDRDFSEIADKIGAKPVAIFGEEDIDRPAYQTKKRRQLGYRVSKNAKHGVQDDEDVDIENVPFSSRVPKHPPLETEPFVNDGEDDDDDQEQSNKIAYQSQKKNNNGGNRGKPLGGIKGANADDDDDDDDDGEGKTSSEKKKKESKEEEIEKGSGEHIPAVVVDDPPFVPSMMYSSSVMPQLPQPKPSPHQYFHQHFSTYPTQGYQVVHHHNQQYSQQIHRPRPQGGFRPLVRPIKIIPGTSGFYRPGRLYPLYG